MIETSNERGRAGISQVQLAREVSSCVAIMMGLGSIIGTGVFVSIAIAANNAGPDVLLAVAIAAGVATCNALSSAQLAANHPVSGGTYEYGYRGVGVMSACMMFACMRVCRVLVVSVIIVVMVRMVMHGKAILL